MIMSHLRSNHAIFATTVGVCGAVGGSGVWELAGEDESGGFVLQDFGGFEDGGQGLIGTGGIHGQEVVVGGHRVGGNETSLGGLSGNVARGRRGRVADGRVRGVRAHETAHVRVDIQSSVVGILVGLIPAGSGEQTRGGAIRNHENHIFDGLGSLECNEVSSNEL